MLSLHNSIFAREDLTSCVAFDKSLNYSVYDLQLYVKTLSVYLSMQRDCRFIALCLDDSFLFTAGFAACLYAKKIPVLLGNYSKNKLSLKQECFDLALTDFNVTEDSINYLNLNELKALCPHKSLAEIPSTNHDAKLTQAPSPSSRIILYTSCTTGKAKRIEKTLEQMEREAQAIAKITTRLDTKEPLKLVCTIPNGYMYSLTFRIMMPLLRRIQFHVKR